MRSEAEIEALVRAFEDCTLPHAAWTHREHLTVALWYLRRHSREDATERVRRGSQRFNAHNGRAAGYHETITLAWIAVISAFLAQHDQGQALAELTSELIETCGDKDYLLRYYSKEILMSDTARRGWVTPDRLSLE
jgi:hypothetical protein